MKKKSFIKRILALTTAAALVLSLAACGNGEQQVAPEGFVYVPEFVDLTAMEGVQNVSGPTLRGEELYFSSSYWDEETEESVQKYYRRNLETGEMVELPLNLNIEGADYSYPMTGLLFDSDNNVVCLINASKTDEEGNYTQTLSLIHI